MATVKLPYGRGYLDARIPDDRLIGVIEPDINDYVPRKTQTELVADALADPVGSPRLSELAVGKKNIVIISSDHTRPVPSRTIMPLILREIRRGNPSAEVTILIATGCHRETTVSELKDKFGEEIAGREKIVIHDCDDMSRLTDVGTLPSGGRLLINSLAVECDLLVAEGFIEPHFFAGFSGGRKSVLPGIAARKSVMYNHNSGFIADGRARTGILDGNPIHADMLAAAKTAKLAFIVNVVINSKKEIIYAVAGSCDDAHRQGCAFLLQRCEARAVPSDIVITTNGGYPLDQNIYQSVKCLTAAEAAVRENGVIIIASQCGDGHGGEAFYNTFRNCRDLDRLTADFLSTPPEETIQDQWQSQIFARVLKKARVIFISDVADDIVRDLHMIPAHSVDEAIAAADGLLGYPGSITAIPDGVSVIIK